MKIATNEGGLTGQQMRTPQVSGGDISSAVSWAGNSYKLQFSLGMKCVPMGAHVGAFEANANASSFAPVAICRAATTALKIRSPRGVILWCFILRSNKMCGSLDKLAGGGTGLPVHVGQESKRVIFPPASSYALHWIPYCIDYHAPCLFS